MALQILRGKTSSDLLTSIADDVSLLPSYVLDDPTRPASRDLVLSNDLATAKRATAPVTPERTKLHM